MIDVNSISNIKDLCRCLGAVVNCIPPKRRKSPLEPDLEYVTVKYADVDEGVSPTVLNEGSNISSDIICYRFRKTGHKTIGHKFSFRRKEGYTVNCCWYGNESRT